MILILAHRHPVLFQPRGGEKSVRIIAEHLAKHWPVRVVVRTSFNRRDEIGGVVYECLRNGDPLPLAGARLLMTWGVAAEETYRVHRETGLPYILMVRWWRNVSPLPPGFLLDQGPNLHFVTAAQLALFQSAAEVITNNVFSARVIKAFFDRLPLVSYVPVEKINVPVNRRKGNPNGFILVATYGKDLGAEEIIPQIARLLPMEHFMAINAGPNRIDGNITFVPYCRDMTAVFDQSKIVLYTVYRNDVCGTSRIALEAMQRGVPTLANDRSGIAEKGIFTVSQNAGAQEWADAITRLSEDYEASSKQARRQFNAYDGAAQLRVYREAVAAALANAALAKEGA